MFQYLSIDFLNVMFNFREYENKYEYSIYKCIHATSSYLWVDVFLLFFSFNTEYLNGEKQNGFASVV